MSKKEIIIVSVLIVITSSRFLFFRPTPPPYLDIIGNDIVLQAKVVDEPDLRFNSKHLNVELINKDVNILVIVRREKDVSYGDIIEVKGVLEEPENFTTESGKEFNYKKYLSNKNIYFIIKNAEVEILSNNNGNLLKSKLYKVRNYFIENINKVIPMPESDLANGLILGVRGGFDYDLRDDFIETGTIHIVALSGYNVSIIAEWVMKIFTLIFSQSVSIIFGILIIFLFVLMTGASATAVRAGIMATIMLLGRMTGRNYMAGRALVITALLMIAYDPLVLVDMSFQLSFIATGGVLFLTPKIMKWFNFVPLRFGFREMLASTVSATISVLPIILYLTGVLSLVSIPANILILLFIPIAMLFIFITGILGFIFPIASIIFGYISYIILHYILFIIELFGALSFASTTIQSFPLILTIIIYSILLYWIFKKEKVY